MPAQIVVPQLGESVVEARVARWLKKPGDPVTAGEPVVELETEKIDLEVGAEHAGVLVEIKRQEGEDVRVGELLAVIGDAQAGATAAPASAPASEPGTTPVSQPAAAPASQPAATPEAVAQPETSTAPAGAAAPAGAMPTQEKVAPSTIGVPSGTAEAAAADRVTPTARKVAEQHAIDLSRIAGTGEGGRVTKKDVETFIASAAPPSATPPPAAATPQTARAETTPAPPAPSVPAGERREERVRLSKRRLTIARNLVEAQHTAAMLTTFNEVDMTALMDLRDRRKEAFKKRHGASLGVASFFVKASVAALKAFPRINAEIQGEEMVLKHYFDIGIAVGAPQGLVVPVLRNAERLTFAEIELAIRGFAQKANDGTLTLDDLRGGTFTITNGGVFGSLLSTPILNPPQVGILGLHKIEERPVAIGGQVVVRPMMYVALTYDHRLVDGLEAVQFLVKVKEFIEDPGHLLIES